MVKRPVAGTLLALFLVGCGASPTNSPQAISNFTQPVGMPTDPAYTTPAATDPAPDATDPDAADPDATDPDATDPSASDAATGSEAAATPAPAPDLLALPEVGGAAGGDEIIPLKNSLFSDWQATGIVSSNGQLFITASDRKGLSQRGTILTLDGKGKWKDVGATKLLGLLKVGHKLNNTVRGIAADAAGNLVAIEAAGHLGSLTSGMKFKLVTGGASGLYDVVSSNSSYYVSYGNQIRRLSGDLASSEAVASNLQITGGMGTDKAGNFYVISQTNVIKVTTTGQSSIVVGNLTNPVDVAVDSKGHILVLQTDSIKEYDASGQPLKDIGAGQITNGAAITVDDSGRIYVADSGTNRKDSQILGFGH